MPDKINPIIAQIQQEIATGNYSPSSVPNIQPDPSREGDTGFQPLNKYDKGLIRGIDQYQNRADVQTGWQAVGNAIVQSAAEVGLGTLEGLGYLLDVDQHINIAKGTEKEFSNWFSDIMKAGKDALREDVTPIYGGDGFDPLNPRWWSKNLPSIFSSLSLLVPTGIATRGLGRLGSMASRGIKANKFGRAVKSGARYSELKDIVRGSGGLSQGTKVATEGIKGALISRYMENTMEASQTAKEQYDQLIAQGVDEAIARDRAGKAASNVWYANLANLATDIPQYMMLFGKTNKALSQMMKSNAAKKKGFVEVLKQMGLEGAEEGLQYGISKEAPGAEDTANTLLNVGRNLGEYFEDDEFYNSVFLGAIGGGVFATAGQVIDKASAKAIQNKKTLSYQQRAQARSQEYTEAQAEGDQTRADNILQDQIVDNAVENPQANEDMAAMVEEENPELAEEIRQTNETAAEIAFDEQDIPEELQGDVVKDTLTINNSYRKLENINASAQESITELDKEFNLDFPNYQPKEDEDTTYSPATILFNKRVNEAANQFQFKDKKIGEKILKDIASNYPIIKGAKLPKQNTKAAKKVRQEATNLATTLIKKALAEEDLKTLKSKEGQQERLAQKQAEIEQKERDKFKKNLKSYTTDTIHDLYKGTNKLAVKTDINEFINDQVEAELLSSEFNGGITQRPDDLTNKDQVLDYYKDKPYALLKDFNFKYKNYNELETAYADGQSKESKKDQTTRANQQAKEETPEETQEEVLDTLSINNEDVVEKEVLDILTLEEEETNKPKGNNPSKNYEIIMSPDRVLYQYQDGVIIPWYGRIAGKSKIRLTKDNYDPKTGVLTVDGKEYYLRANLPIGANATLGEQKYSLLDSSGTPEVSGYGNIYQIDRDWIKNQKENLANISNVRLTMKPSDWNKKQVNLNNPNPTIYVEAGGHIVGVLQAPSKYAEPKYKQLFEDMFEQYKQNPEQEFALDFNIPVKKILGGYPNTQRNQRNVPSSVLNQGQEYILAIGYSKPGAGLFLNSNGSASINSTNITEGDVYLLSTNFAGKQIPLRVFTKKVKDVIDKDGNKLSHQLLKAINKFNVQAARNIVKFNLLEKEAKKIKPDFNEKVLEKFGNTKLFFKNGNPRSYTSKYNGLYNSKKKTTTLDVLNRPGAIIASKSKEKGKLYDKIYGIATTNISGNPNQIIKLVELDENLDRTGNIETLPLSDLNDFYLHYAYHYAEFYDLFNRRSQIDVNKINTSTDKGDYNRDIADYRLESDLVPQEHFHSPNFILDFEPYFNKEITSRSETTTENASESPIEVPEQPEVVEVTTEEIDEKRQKRLDKLRRFTKTKGKPVTTDTVSVDSVIDEELNKLTKEERSQLNREEIKKAVTQDLSTKADRPNNNLFNRVVNAIKKALLTLLVSASFFIGSSFITPNNTTDLTYDNINIENLVDFNNILEDQELINKTNNINIINSFETGKGNTYIIVDKTNALAHLHQDGKLITTFEVGTGKTKGDAQTKTVAKNGKVYWEQGNKQTGAGIYTVSGKGKYKNSQSYTLKNERGVEVSTVLHETLWNRKKLFADNNKTNNRMSYGCINFQAKDLKKLDEYKEFTINSKVYILPDNNLNKFTLVDNDLRFISNDVNVNRTVKPYIPHEVKFNASGINKTTRDFLDAISNYKADIMEEYPTISNDLYNQIASIAYGILGQESSFGTYGGPRGKFGFVKDEIASRLTDVNLSLGVTQIRLTSIPNKIRTKFNITKENLRDSPETSAIATMGVLFDIYVNQIPNSKKHQFKELLPLGYNNRTEFNKAIKGDKSALNNHYIKNVNNSADNLEIYASIENATPKYRRATKFWKYNQWNETKEKAWIKKNLPDIDVKVLEDLKGIANEKLWGLFYNSIYVTKNAAEGTLYHEAFHAIFDIYLTTQQQERLYEEARKRYPNINPLDTLALEEAMADDFMRYTAAREQNQPTEWIKKLGKLIVEFFERLFNTRQYILNKDKITIDKLFKYGNTGVFRGQKKLRRSGETKFRRIDQLVEEYDFSPSEVQDAINLGANLLNEALQEHLSKGGDINAIVSGKNNLLTSLNIPYSLVNKLIEHVDNYPGELTEEMEYQLAKFFDALAEYDDNNLATPGPLYREIQQEMSKYGYIITNNITEKAEELEETNEDTNTRDSWGEDQLKVNPITRLSSKLQLFFGSIPQVEWKDKAKGDIQEKYGYLGFPKYHSTGYVYLQLQNTLGNSTSSTHMISKLDEKATTDPLFFKIRNELKKDLSKITDVWVAVGQKIKPKFVAVTQTNKGLKATLANRGTLRAFISEDLTSSFLNTSPLFKNNKFDEDLADKLIKYEAETLNDVKKYFRNFGLSISEDTYTRMDEDVIKALKQMINGNHPDYGQAMNIFLQEYMKGNDPITDGHELMSWLARIIQPAYDELVQNSHKNPTGGQVYEWINSNFAGRLINQLKDKEIGTQLLESLMRDPIYKNLPLLQKIYQQYTGTAIPGQKTKLYKKFNIDKLNFSILAEFKSKGQSKGIEYKDMTEKQVWLSMLSMYHRSPNSGTISIPLPVHSDAGVMTFLEVPAGKQMGQIENGYLSQDGDKLIMSELTDIAYIEFLRTQNKIEVKNKENYDSKKKLGKKFIYFDNLNNEYNTLVRLHEEGGFQAIEDILQQAVKEKVEQLIKSNLSKLEELSIVTQDKDTGKYEFAEKIPDNVNVEAFLPHYVANHMLYSAQIGIMMNGDIGFYKSITDYYKRAKQVWSPGINLDTNAEWTNESTGKTHRVREFYNVKYLKDVEQAFQHEDITKVLIGLYGEKEGKRLADKYKSVNETDAQSYSDLYKYREEQIGLGRWNQEKQLAYDRIMLGQSNQFDIDAIFNATKPFYYGLHQPDEFDGTIVPTQNKDSQFYLAPLPVFTNPTSKLYNSKYVEMLEDMGYSFDPMGNLISFDETGRDQGKYTDKFTFESAIKVGLYGQSDNIAEAKTHQFNNNDWRLQMETPSHFIDDRVMFATQVRAHMINNLDKEYTLDEAYKGKTKFTGEELLKLYNDVVIKDIQDSYDQIAKKFTDMNSLLQLLREEVVSRGLGLNYLEALDINPITGKTNIPLWHPMHIYRIESMLNSLFTNRVVKQKLSQGVTYINLSSYGFKNKPKLVFKSDNSLDYVEAYAPSHSEEIYRYADERGLIDIKTIEDVNPKLLEGMVWRIPNEEKYSTFKIKIIGFLPKELGGVIVMPPEVTTIAGLDFDIDKTPGFFYNIKRKWDWEKLINVLSQKAGLNIPKDRRSNLLDLITLQYKSYEDFIRNYDPNDADHLAFKRLLFNLTPAELKRVSKLNVGNISMDNKSGRDNLKMLLMRAVMSNKETTRAFLNPGGYDTLTKNNMEIIIPKRKDLTARVITDEETGRKEIVDDINPVDPSTHAMIADRMLTGKALIGVFANAVKAHNFFQKVSELEIITPFRFDGIEFTRLNNKFVYDPRETSPEQQQVISKISDLLSGKLISRNIAEPLAASVDNGKDPQLGYSNINGYTVDVAVGMLMTGIDLLTVQAFLSQPEIIAFTKYYFQNGANKQAERKAFEKFNIKRNIRNGNGFAVNFDTDKLVNRIGQRPSMNAVLDNFLIYKKLAKPVNNLILAIKVGEGGLGPTDSHNIQKMDQLNPSQFKNIIGSDNVLETKKDQEKNTVQLYKSYDDIWKANKEFTLYPNMINSIIEKARVHINALGLPDRNGVVFNMIRSNMLNYKPDGWLTADEIEFINMDYLTYLHFLINPFDPQLANDLPVKLAKYKADNSDGEYTPFINRLHITEPDPQDNMKYIYFAGQGIDQDLIRYTWEKMLLSDNEQDSQLAQELIDYALMLNGFRITPGAFSNLIPQAYYKDQKQVENINKLEELIKASETQSLGEVADKFTEQFIRNHFRTLTFIPKVRNEDGDKNIIRLETTENNKPYRVTVEDKDFKGKDGEWVNYIKHSIYNKKGKFTEHYLFELDYGASDEKQATYKVIAPMGTYSSSRGKMLTEYNAFGTTMVNTSPFGTTYEETFYRDYVNRRQTEDVEFYEEYNVPTENTTNLLESGETIDKSNPLNCKGNKIS